MNPAAGRAFVAIVSGITGRWVNYRPVFFLMKRKEVTTARWKNLRRFIRKDRSSGGINGY
jgi:hypothetical protein